MDEMSYNDIVGSLGTDVPAQAARALNLSGYAEGVSTRQVDGIIEALVNGGRFVKEINLTDWLLEQQHLEDIAVFLDGRRDIEYTGPKLPQLDEIVINSYTPKRKNTYDAVMRAAYRDMERPSPRSGILSRGAADTASIIEREREEGDPVAFER